MIRDSSPRACGIAITQCSRLSPLRLVSSCGCKKAVTHDAVDPTDGRGRESGSRSVHGRVHAILAMRRDA